MSKVYSATQASKSNGRKDWYAAVQYAPCNSVQEIFSKPYKGKGTFSVAMRMTVSWVKQVQPSDDDVSHWKAKHFESDDSSDDDVTNYKAMLNNGGNVVKYQPSSEGLIKRLVKWVSHTTYPHTLRGYGHKGQSLQNSKQAIAISPDDLGATEQYTPGSPEQRLDDEHCMANATNSMAELENDARDAFVQKDHHKDHENPACAAEAEYKLLDTDKVQAESQSSRCCWRVVLSFIALPTSFIICSYVTAVFAVQITPQNQEKHVQAVMFNGDQMSFQEVCLDCQRLVKNPYIQFRNDPMVADLTQRMEGNVLKCCAENHRQMSAMLKAVGRRPGTIKEVFPAAYADMQKSSTVSVHKKMISETWNSLTGYSVVKFDPNNNQGLGEQIRGATILEDGIVILKSGTYYIYTNVFFKVNETEKASSNQKWSSHVHLTHPQWDSRTGILLTSVHTLCHNCTRDFITNFTGGIFQLQSGDIIQVFLSDVGLVYFNRISSYLGLVILSK